LPNQAFTSRGTYKLTKAAHGTTLNRATYPPVSVSGHKEEQVSARHSSENEPIRLQSGGFNGAVVTGSLKFPSECNRLTLPRPSLPENPSRPRLPLPSWESQVRKGRFSGMTRKELHEARKEAREYLVDWMWRLPLRHSGHCSVDMKN